MSFYSNGLSEWDISMRSVHTCEAGRRNPNSFPTSSYQSKMKQLGFCERQFGLWRDKSWQLIQLKTNNAFFKL